MRAFIDDSEYQGTPNEIADFLYLRESNSKLDSDLDPPFDSGDFKPFEDIVNDSEKLRKELTINPDFNPFGGVVPSKEGDPEVTSTALNAPFTAEADTGVELK